MCEIIVAIFTQLLNFIDISVQGGSGLTMRDEFWSARRLFGQQCAAPLAGICDDFTYIYR